MEQEDERLVLEIDTRRDDFTYEEYCSWPGWFSCEIIDGELYARHEGKINGIIRVYTTPSLDQAKAEQEAEEERFRQNPEKYIEEITKRAMEELNTTNE